MRLHLAHGTAVALLACLAVSAARAATRPAEFDFFDAAECKPPIEAQVANRFADEAAKLGPYDVVGITMVHKLPAPRVKGDLSTQALVLSGNSIGVLLEGAQAEALARRFDLQPERLSALRPTVTLGFARALKPRRRPGPFDPVVSIVARESTDFPGQTMLLCETLGPSEVKAFESQ